MTMARILVVCTGNTCRSPMLAALVRHRRPDLQVESAGTAAGMHEPASDGACLAMERRGLTLNAHASRPVDGLDLSSYDRIYAMTPRHAAHLRSLGVPSERLAVVSAAHGGVPDPFGGDDHAYEACALVLESAADNISQEFPR